MRSPFFTARDEDGDSFEIEDLGAGVVVLRTVNLDEVVTGEVYLSREDENALIEALLNRRANGRRAAIEGTDTDA